MQVIEGAGVFVAAGGGEANHWGEHMASADLSVGTYSIPAGGRDDQEPHREDEIYVVQSGAATLVTDTGTTEVRPGAVIFVPAGERHQFTDVRGDLALLVIFAPPYGSRAGVEK
jgi:mannose-6-phosphate isomerase-like protein (cupin superfamily)